MVWLSDPRQPSAKQRDRGPQVHPGLVVFRGLAVPVQALIAGGDAPDGPVLAIEDLGGGEAGIDFHAQGLGLGGQPAAKAAQADDVVAPVPHTSRHGQGKGPALRQKHEPVVRGRSIERRAPLLPVGDQLNQALRIQHRARQDVGADLGALVDQTDGDRSFVFGRQLAEPDGRRQPRRPAADDDHVEMHGVRSMVPR